MPTRHLIIGNSAAGMSAAEEIRKRDPAADIAIIGDEPYPMYSRPGLAYLLMGEIPEEAVFCRRPEYYTEQRLRWYPARATALDLHRRAVQLDDGSVFRFDTLLLATGATAVPAPFPGSQLDGVVYLDSFRNVQDMLRRIDEGAHTAVVVGGGITAMEMAEGLFHRGLQVHYLLRNKAIWPALMTDAESRICESHARRKGIQVHFEQELVEILGAGGRVAGVRTSSGDEIACQMVGVSIGVRPNVALANGTRIRVDRGIVVNEFLETLAPGVFAAGDVAQVVDGRTRQGRVDNLWPSAITMGRVAGANMSGAHEPYIQSVPFNATLIFGMHLSALGQVGADRPDGDNANESVQYQSRGTSDAWWAHPSKPYVSAWSQDGDHSLRLVLSGNHLVGALILGNQDLADPLRDLIAHRVDLSPIRAQLQTDVLTVGRAVRSLWEQWQHSHPCEADSLEGQR